MPFRTRTETPVANSVEGHFVSSCTGLPRAQRNWFGHYAHNRCVDYNNVGYLAVMQAGGFVNTYCAFRFSNWSQPGGGSAVYRLPSTVSCPENLFSFEGHSLTGYFSGGSTPHAFSHEFTASLRSVSRQKALARVDPPFEEFFEDLGELILSIKAATVAVQRVKKSARSFNERVKERMRRANENRTQASAGVWLTYRFFIMPLIRSALNLIAALGTNVPPSLPRYTSRGGAETLLEESDPVVTPSASYSGRLRVSEVWQSGIIYTMTNPVTDWRWRFGLRAKDIIPGLWNLVPLSFMVDRFLNISDMLKGMHNLADLDVTIQAAWSRGKIKNESVFAIDTISGYDWVQFKGDVVKVNLDLYDRSPWTPSLGDTIPEFNISGLFDSLTKLTDVIALTISFMSGRRR